MTAWRRPDIDATTDQTLDRLCRRLGDAKAPYDEISRSRAEARLDAALARAPSPRRRRPPGSMVVAFLAGALAAAFVAFVVVPRARPRPPAPAPSRLQFEPYVVAPLDAPSLPSSVPDVLVRSSARLDVPPGWLVRAKLGEAIFVTLTGPAHAWVEHAGNDGQVVVHLDDGRLLASLDGTSGSRLAVVSPGAVTEVVGTLFAVEVVGRASRVSVAHGRVGVVATAAAMQDRAPAREVTGGQSWLTAQPRQEALEPALAESLAEHERTPPPRGAAVELSLGNHLPGADVWIGDRRIGSAPAWARVDARAAVRLSEPPTARATGTGTFGPEPPAPESPPPAALASGPATAPPRASAAPRLLTPSRSLALAATSLALATAPLPLVPAEPTARSLFREADRARAAGNSALAMRMLRALVTRYPRDPSAAAARYELALMEHATGDEDAALGDLAALADPALDEPARYLRCRVLAPRASADADRCLADFRRQFPKSPHDADGLAARAALALARGGCPSARAPLAELASRYPLHRSVVRLRAACPERP